MKIIWLGHASFRIEAAGEVLLIDPWLDGNPSFPDAKRPEALAGATHILLTHGHFDHTSEVAGIAQEIGAIVCAIPEIASVYGAYDIKTVQFNKGGTIKIGTVEVTMVNATHSSSMATEDGTIYAGTESGFMIAAEHHVIYVSGDTDIMADMEWMGDLHAPDIGLLCAGGHFTMDMKRAAYAAKRYFNFKTVIPCHYKTFPLLEQSAQALIDALPDVDVIEPEVMVAIEV
ncbi:MAG: L-ascorbate metabolism protein UlaG (beta-lactamase superfamily) [Paracoccaceae bacterium]|jgi:L-ascorbate metabolism protein UlaG (beta-lactamase superfamily)